MLVVLIILFIILVLFNCRVFKEYFSDKTFKQIGNGPAIDVDVMTVGQNGIPNSWQSESSDIPYVNHEKRQIMLSGDEFRAINGFIPPSFEYFPFGPNSPDEYNEKEFEEGREQCFQRCRETDCLAVQTEVPQMCYQKRKLVAVPEGFEISGNASQKFMTVQGDCQTKSTHTCTLFYGDTEKADDAYYRVSKNDQGTVGSKYYENNTIPKISPNKDQLPSESTIKWCPPQVTQGNFGSRYKTVSGASCDCSREDCEDPMCCPCMPKYNSNGELVRSENEDCDDPRCCVYRKLLTTEFAKHNTPYYHLPINTTKYDELEKKGPSAICPAVDQSGNCCGLCRDNDLVMEHIESVFGKGDVIKKLGLGEISMGDITNEIINSNIPYKLVSCPLNRKYLDGKFNSAGIQNSGIYWKVDTEKSQCGSDPENNRIIGNIKIKAQEECLQEFKDNYDSNRKLAYSKLIECCEYLDQACLGITVQPFCSTGVSDTKRGCYGDPQILNVDKVSNNIAACSDTSVIPPRNRCVEDSEGKICKYFPYSCNSGPLWKYA